MPNVMTMFKSSAYLTAADLFDDKTDKYRDVVVQIESVKQGEIVGEKGRTNGMPFVYFKGKNKPLGCNKTNIRSIIRITGTLNYEKWVGVWLTLYVQKVDGKDGAVDAIRIDPTAAKPPDSKKSKDEPKPDPAFDPSDVQPEGRA